MREGGTLRLPSVRDCRHLFDWVLADSSGARLALVEDGLMELQGLEFSVLLPPTSSFAFCEVFLNDTYRINAIRRPLGIVIDLGANVGLFAVRIAPLAQRVICVEPVGANLSVARKNVGRMERQYADRVTFHQKAVAGESGCRARIFLSDVSSGAHSTFREHTAELKASSYEDVSTICLPDLFQRESVDHCSLLKCDVEGAEFDVFRSAPRETLMKIDRIVMEVHPTVCDQGSHLVRELRATLELAGFRVSHEPLFNRRGKPKRAVMLFATRRHRSLAPPAAASIDAYTSTPTMHRQLTMATENGIRWPHVGSRPCES
ncbi:MAG TPA: FkbM family methyltransferase [Thermoguttaceae bacterium]|nr:FkbM family methyltransferase [Thermoguttaceae bacterium]